MNSALRRVSMISLRRLALLVELPMTARVLVRRIENRVFEEVIAHRGSRTRDRPGQVIGCSGRLGMDEDRRPV